MNLNLNLNLVTQPSQIAYSHANFFFSYKPFVTFSKEVYKMLACLGYLG